jgi:hypothetical protein
MKTTTLVLASLLLVPGLRAADDAGWIPILDGKSLAGWKSNDEKTNVFSVENGELKVAGGRAHLFYVGPDGNAKFKDFEFKAKVRTTPGSNSGIYFHTAFEAKGWPSQGYECQVNSTHTDRKKTGGLYAIKDVLDNAPSKDGEWFDYEIKVQGKQITLKIDGKVTAEFTEPADWQPPQGMPGRKLGEGTFAIQGHDPKSVTYYKDLAVRPLK